MASVTSGELLYGLCDLHKINLLPAEESGRRSGNNTISSNNELQTFLAGKLQDQTDLHLIRELRERIETAHEASIAHLKHSVPHELSAINRALVLECQIEKERLAHTIHKLQKTFEAQAMQSILRYVSVVKEDMDSAKKQLDHERQQKEALKKQALVCRDFLMFCCHLRQETSGRLEITCLPHSSAQFIRCVKAVHDNLGDSFGKLTRRRRIKPEDARVLNVFKVKNLHLSKKLHVSIHFVSRAVLC